MTDDVVERAEETLLRAVAVAMGVPVSVSEEAVSPGGTGVA